MKRTISLVLALGISLSACSSTGNGSSSDVPVSSGPSDCTRVGIAVIDSNTAYANAEAKFQKERAEYEQARSQKGTSDEFVWPPINNASEVRFAKLKEGFAQAWPRMQDPVIQELVRELSKENDWEANVQALRSLCPGEL